ncbi:MAG: hypothetical protein ABF335_03180 [Alphaproteobacteria bacterium]
MSDIKFSLPGKDGFEVDWPVTLQVPEDGGTFTQVEVSARFVMLPQNDIGTMSELFTDGGQVKLLKRVVKELRGIGGADGKPIDWAMDADTVLGWGFMKRGLLTAFTAAMQGHMEKN